MENDQDSFELVESRDAIELVPSGEVQLWWFLVGGVVLVVMILSVLYFKRRKVEFDPAKAELQAFRKARTAFEEMDVSGIRETAVRVSLILRGYLAESLGEPALFQTHEEFVARHDALEKLPEEIKAATGQFFGEMAAVKYGPDEPGEIPPADLKSKGEKLLERIHSV